LGRKQNIGFRGLEKGADDRKVHRGKKKPGEGKNRKRGVRGVKASQVVGE